MGLTAQKTAICHDRTVHDIPTRVWTIKHQGDWLWRVAEWLLGTFCDEESPVTLAQSPIPENLHKNGPSKTPVKRK